MSLIAGDTLVKRYRILHILGKGRSGSVYRAWDERDDRDVAIKEYLDASYETQKLFREEARRLSRLKHPQLPTVRDHFVVDEVGQYLVTDYVDGVDLQTLVEQSHPLPSERVVEWLQESCVPLDYLHQKGQLHLNIKPANIRVTPRGEVFLVDTGLPRLGVPRGNPGYAALEQQTQKQVSETTDVYALGATLYTLLTGRTPVDAARREMGLEQLRPARQLNPDAEPYLSLVASRAMSLRANTRFDTVLDFAKALTRPTGSKPFQRVELPDPAPVPLPPRVQVNQRQWRTIETRTLLALGVILLVMVLGGVAYGSFGRTEPTPTTIEVTATFQSQVALALTQIAPSPTPTIDPTTLPTATPERFVHGDSGARMIYIEGGNFRMGNDEGESDEQPAHLVRLDPYFIDESEVTNRQYSLCVADGLCSPPQNPNATFHPSYYGDPKFDNYPVIFVSWDQANTFCEWRDGRLPSEAEWEFAAGYRAEVAQKLRFPWGELLTSGVANFCDSNCTLPERDPQIDDGHRDTAPVGTFPEGQSSFGLYDMAGNVMEWVHDWYDPDFYEVSSDINPLGPAEGVARVLRGGSWLSTVEDLQVTTRGSFVPEVARANLGFRCAMTPE